MIAAGLQLMVLGMTIVFVFLILLVFLMSLMGALVRRFAPEPVTAPSTGAAASASAAAGSFDTHIPAVLAAVAAHRARTRHAAQTAGASASNTTT